VIVVADGTKVGRILLARIAPLSDVDELITTDTADPVALAAIRHAGVAVHVAPVPAAPPRRAD
jgi:DeoR family transcriptional regulator of aga operon